MREFRFFRDKDKWTNYLLSYNKIIYTHCILNMPFPDVEDMEQVLRHHDIVCDFINDKLLTTYNEIMNYYRIVFENTGWSEHFIITDDEQISMILEAERQTLLSLPYTT